MMDECCALRDNLKEHIASHLYRFMRHDATEGHHIGWRDGSTTLQVPLLSKAYVFHRGVRAILKMLKVHNIECLKGFSRWLWI